MSYTWNAVTPPQPDPIGPAGWARIVLKGVVIGAMVLGGALLLILLRLVERPIAGDTRPITAHFPRVVLGWVLRVLGLRLERRGQLMTAQGALVANHSSWLDIFVLNASACVTFVSKAEVRGWPVIGWLASITGTVFIERDRTQAAAQTRVIAEHLRKGHKLLFFPEGTSTDNQRVLPFKSSLFAAFFQPELHALCIQPVTVSYCAPDGAHPAFYGWWGDMGFGPNFLAMLAAPRHGRVVVTFDTPLHVADFKDRKSLAQACETRVRKERNAHLAR